MVILCKNRICKNHCHLFLCFISKQVKEVQRDLLSCGHINNSNGVTSEVLPFILFVLKLDVERI